MDTAIVTDADKYRIIEALSRTYPAAPFSDLKAIEEEMVASAQTKTIQDHGIVVRLHATGFRPYMSRKDPEAKTGNS